MKRQLIFGTMLSAALAVGVAAQQAPPTGTASPAPGAQPPSDRASQSLTLTGCLQASGGAGGATAAPGAATASPGSQASGGGFVLTDIKPAGSMASGSTGPGAGTAGTAGTSGTGAPGASAGSASARSYRLTGGESQDLQKHVGQRVEVTGSVAASASGATAGSTTAAPGASATPSSSAQGPSLRVASVRPTGEKCNQ